MKKIVVLILVVISMSSFKVPFEISNFNIVGKWVGVDDKNNKGAFVFDSEGYATMIVDGEVMGGKEFEMKGATACMKYKIDETSKPIKFDIIVTTLNTKKSRTMKMLLKIVDNNTIKLASDFNDIRPKSFTKENTLLLKRE